MSVYFYGCMTMDGYLADKNHGLNWLHQTGTIDATDFEGFYRNMDITIMGRRTFQEIERMDNAGEIYPTTKNYVFTHKTGSLIDGFTPVNCGVREFVGKFGADKNIWVIGGNTLLAPLLESDMVDHMLIQVAPVLLGDGIPLFAQKEALKRFRLDEVRKYGQFAELVYSRPDLP